MSGTVKYTLGRLGLFLAAALALWPVPLNLLLKLMIAVLVSAVLAYFLLRPWRDEMARDLARGVERRRAERERLRRALAGDDAPATAAAAAGPPATAAPGDGHAAAPADGAAPASRGAASAPADPAAPGAATSAAADPPGPGAASAHSEAPGPAPGDGAAR